MIFKKTTLKLCYDFGKDGFKNIRSTFFNSEIKENKRNSILRQKR